jgi:tetratricopeptide (TPR) repeat protein
VREGERRFPAFPRLQYLHAALEYLQGDEAQALSRMRKLVDEHPAFEEALNASAELAFLAGAADAEAQIERMFRRAPGLLTGPLLKQESHQTTYAFMLATRGDRPQAEELLGRAMAHARAVLADGSENQRVPFEIAAIHAVRGEHDSALTWLEKAAAAGYADYSTLGRHPIFAAVRADPRFQRVLAGMQQRVAAMRERTAALPELRSAPFSAIVRSAE